MSLVKKDYDGYHAFEKHMIIIIECIYTCHINSHNEVLSC
jgi:hypothetical protein